MEKKMSIENQVRAVAGVFILVSLALYHFHSHHWLYFTAFVGLNLLQSAFTRFCPLEILLRKSQTKGEVRCP
jgi:hypothetical protein